MKKQKLFYLSLLFSSLLLVTILSLLTITPSQAVDPTIAVINDWRGNSLTLRQGSERNSTPLKKGQRNELNSPDDILSIPGDNKSIAQFVFGIYDVKEYGGLRVRTIPREIASEYRFPCRGSGSYTIGWRASGDQGDRACAEGIKLTPGQSSRWSWWRIIQDRIASKGKLYAQTDDEVTVKPDAGEVIIQTNDTATGIDVDVVLGNVDVTSSRFPNGRTIRAGERYSYPQDKVSPIDVNAIKNTPDFRDFVNPNNWLTPDLTDRISQPLSEHINSDQIALGQPMTNPQLKISGEWKYESMWFGNNCTPEPEKGLSGGMIDMLQQGNQVQIQSGIIVNNNPNPLVKGTLSGNQFNTTAYDNNTLVLEWNGVVSNDGNQIKGDVFCFPQRTKVPFTMTRKKDNQSSTASCPISGQWEFNSATDFGYNPESGFFDGGPPYTALIEITENQDKITFSSFYRIGNGPGTGKRIGEQIIVNIPLKFGSGQLTGDRLGSEVLIKGQIVFSDGLAGHTSATIPFTMKPKGDLPKKPGVTGHCWGM